MQRGSARFVEERVEVAVLSAQGGARGEEAFDESTALGAVAAEAAFALEHGEANCALGGVVRGLDALDIDKGEERHLQLEDLAAHAADLGAGQSSAFFEQRQDSAPHGATGELEFGAGHGSVAHPIPEPEELSALGQELFA